MTRHLQGKRILVTRSEPQASVFAASIKAANGRPVVAPLIQIACVQSKQEEEMIKQLKDYVWIFFTSANGVTCFFEKVQAYAQEDALGQVKFAVVGEKTNAALKAYGYEAAFIPDTYDAATMAPAFLADHKGTGPMLIVRGRLSGTVLNEAFARHGIAFDCLEVYETVTNKKVKRPLTKTLQENSVDMITFTSPSTVDAFIELAPENGWTKDMPVACIGTTTEKRALEHGFTHLLVPKVFTVEGMIEVMHDYFAQKG